MNAPDDVPTIFLFYRTSQLMAELHFSEVSYRQHDCSDSFKSQKPRKV